MNARQAVEIWETDPIKAVNSTFDYFCRKHKDDLEGLSLSEKVNEFLEYAEDFYSKKMSNICKSVLKTR